VTCSIFHIDQKAGLVQNGQDDVMAEGLTQTRLTGQLHCNTRQRATPASIAPPGELHPTARVYRCVAAGTC
jgi:hypothetical protein